MDLHEIAIRGGWRALVPPGLRGAQERMERQGVHFFWTCSGEGASATYVFNAGRQDGSAVIASCDGSEMPRQAISEVILETMTALGAFPQQAAPQGRSRR